MYAFCFRFAAKYSSKKWLLICEEETRVDLSGLTEVLQRFDPEKVCHPHSFGPKLQSKQIYENQGAR